MFIRNAAAVGPRPHPEALRALILDICRHRDWTTPAELARWFDMHRRSLANRYIRPLLEAGMLERQFPDSPNTPKQAYRTRREDPARSEAGTGSLAIPEGLTLGQPHGAARRLIAAAPPLPRWDRTRCC